MQDILTAITTVGFPIVMCLLLMWYNRDQATVYDERVKAFTEAISKMNTTLTRVLDRLGMEDEDNGND